MNIKIIFFIFAMLLTYIGLNAYVILRIANLFSIDKNWIFYVIFSILILSFPVAMILERFSGVIEKIIYIISVNYLGILFFTFCTLIIFELVNLAYKLDKRVAGIVIIGLVLIITIYSLLNTNIFVKKINIPMNKDIRIVQISDVHLGKIHGYSYMEDIVKKINKINPDIVMITGDLFDGSEYVPQDTVNLINSINGKVYFSTGNHEIYYGLDKATEQLNKTKVKILRNEIEVYKGIQIIGIDNPLGFVSKGNSELEKMNISSPSILMYHLPTGLDVADKKGIDLQLSGHVHSGQIFPFNLIVKMFFPKINGLYKMNKTYMYVSAGTGTWGPRMRFGSKSEITLIDLK